MGYLYVYMKLLDIIFESVVDMNEKKGVKMTRDEFIQIAQSIHKNKDGIPKYTYNNVKYIDNKSRAINTNKVNDLTSYLPCAYW